MNVRHLIGLHLLLLLLLSSKIFLSLDKERDEKKWYQGQSWQILSFPILSCFFLFYIVC